ncbi:MAG: maltose alpha-D-glucosyltransferase, partial [Pseudomonas putida]
MTQPDPSYVKWLEDRAMLKASQERASLYSGQSRLWQQPYAEAQPRRATEIASVWLTVYPDAIIAPQDCSVLGALAHEALWKRLSEIGIQGLHTGPIKLSGGIRGRELTPSVDGNFDRISFDIDPLYGSEQELVQMSRMAAAHNAVTIDDLIPSHTGKGADFRLAEMAHGPYPGLYHMVEIREEDWPLLPEVPTGRDSVNLLPAQCDELKARHYIVG